MFVVVCVIIVAGPFIPCCVVFIITVITTSRLSIWNEACKCTRQLCNTGLLFLVIIVVLLINVIVDK